MWTVGVLDDDLPDGGPARGVRRDRALVGRDPGRPAAQRRLPAGAVQRGVDGGRPGCRCRSCGSTSSRTRRTRGRATCWRTGRWCAAWSGPTRTTGYGVGFYSYDNGWRAVVGSWRKPAYPTWVPVGPVANGWAVAPRPGARRRRFSGGPVLLAQWVQDSRDRDVTCPLLHGRARRAAPADRAARDHATPRVSLRPGGHHAAARAADAAAVRHRPASTPRTERVLLAFQRQPGLPAHRGRHRPRADRPSAPAPSPRPPQPAGRTSSRRTDGAPTASPRG